MSQTSHTCSDMQCRSINGLRALGPGVHSQSHWLATTLFRRPLTTSPAEFVQTGVQAVPDKKALNSGVAQTLNPKKRMQL